MSWHQVRWGGAKYLELLLPELSSSFRVTAITSPGGVLPERSSIGCRGANTGRHDGLSVQSTRFVEVISAFG